MIFVAGAIPFIKSYFGATLGVVAGMSPPVAIAAAVVGNVVSMALLVSLAGRMRGATNADREALSPKKPKLKIAFDRYGVARVSLWRAVSITVWSTAFGVLTALGVSAFLPLAG